MLEFIVLFMKQLVRLLTHLVILGLKMSEKEKRDFFLCEWNRICEKEEKEKDRQAMLQAKREKLEFEQ